MTTAAEPICTWEVMRDKGLRVARYNEQHMWDHYLNLKAKFCLSVNCSTFGVVVSHSRINYRTVEMVLYVPIFTFYGDFCVYKVEFISVQLLNPMMMQPRLQDAKSSSSHQSDETQWRWTSPIVMQLSSLHCNEFMSDVWFVIANVSNETIKEVNKESNTKCLLFCLA